MKWKIVAHAHSRFRFLFHASGKVAGWKIMWPEDNFGLRAHRSDPWREHRRDVAYIVSSGFSSWAMFGVLNKTSVLNEKWAWNWSWTEYKQLSELVNNNTHVMIVNIQWSTQSNAYWNDRHSQMHIGKYWNDRHSQVHHWNDVIASFIQLAFRIGIWTYSVEAAKTITSISV